MKKTPRKQTSKKSAVLDVHTNEDVKRYIGAVAEHFTDQVSAVAEQFLGLNEKIDAQGAMLGKKLDEHALILNEHSVLLREHTHMIGQLLVDTEDIKVNLKEKVSRDEFNKLEKRLVSLEAFVFTGQGRKKSTKANK